MIKRLLSYTSRRTVNVDMMWNSFAQKIITGGSNGTVAALPSGAITISNEIARVATREGGHGELPILRPR